jgi:hypothetical protein
VFGRRRELRAGVRRLVPGGVAEVFLRPVGEELVALALADRVIAQGRDPVPGQQDADPLIRLAALPLWLCPQGIKTPG